MPPFAKYATGHTDLSASESIFQWTKFISNYAKHYNFTAYSVLLLRHWKCLLFLFISVLVRIEEVLESYNLAIIQRAQC